MSQIIGMDFSAEIISDLEQRLNQKGILIHSQEATAEGTRITAIGMGNRKQTALTVPKLEEQPSDEDAAASVGQYLSEIESGLRAARMPLEESL